MRIEQAMRDQREQQQIFEIQQQKDSILKWNAKNIMPAAVKSLAEIQAEEHAKQTAAERELAAQQAAKQREKEKEIHLQNSSSSFFTAWNNATTQQSVWNSGNKVWGSGNNSSSNSTSGGGFWEEPTKVTNIKPSTPGNKMLAKSQTMGSITTNKAAVAEKQAQQQQQQPPQLQPKAVNKSTGNVVAPPLGNPSGSIAKESAEKKGKVVAKGDKKSDNGFNAEFTEWCHKALGNINAEVDGKFFCANIVFVSFSL